MIKVTWMFWGTLPKEYKSRINGQRYMLTYEEGKGTVLAPVQLVSKYQIMPFISDILTNDEVSTDEELVEHFKKEIRMTDKEARAFVARREEFLCQL